MTRLAERLGAAVIDGVMWVGGVSILSARAIWLGPRRPFGITDIARQILEQGVRSLPIASLLAMFTGMILAWQFGDALVDFGATMALGYTASVSLVTELVPTFMAITVGSKISAGMAAELGSMKVTEQIDAVAALGADPVKKLVWPRIVGTTITIPLLVAWGNVLAFIGSMLIAEWEFGVPAGYYYETYIDMLTPRDYAASLVKGTIYGFMVGSIGCYQGFNTQRGTEAVGTATTATVVACAICIIVADFYITMRFFQVG